MATLKGQNFRIMIWNATDQEYTCIGMSTTCTVTLTNNTEDARHKDIVGAADVPVMTSQSWQVSVNSLDVADTAAILTTFKSMTPVTLCWDETRSSDNQSNMMASYSRKGQAFLNDCTFQFDDRTNSTKALQFQGTGALTNTSSSEVSAIVTPGSYTKGQFVRLFLGSDNSTAPTTVIAAAKTLSLHCSLTLEDATTKDTAGNWQVQEPTGYSYDISTGALMRSGETITSQVGGKSISDLETIYEAGTPVKWKIANVSGDNNRTASSTIVSGSVVLTQLTINGPDRQKADYTAQMSGYGDYTVAA